MSMMTTDQIIGLGICEDYPDEKVRSLAGGIDTWTLEAILAHPELTAEEKLWVAIHSDLLSPEAKRRVACAIAEHVLPKIEEHLPDNRFPELAVSIAREFSEEDEDDRVDSVAIRSAVRASISNRAGVTDLPYEVRGAVDAAWSAAELDASTALIQASSCARAAAGPEGDEEEVAWQLEAIRREAQS